MSSQQKNLIPFSEAAYDKLMQNYALHSVSIPNAFPFPASCALWGHALVSKGAGHYLFFHAPEQGGRC